MKRKLSNGERMDKSSASEPTSQPQSRANHTLEGEVETVQNTAKSDKHYAELYTKAPDFKELAKRDPEFAQVLGEEKSNFFNDPKCVMQLTKTLLKLDFGLEIHLPDDRLCPPVTNRHNYILWLKGLLDTTTDDDELGRNVVGLDIGTGASCIYPLLGCIQRPWSFIATDIDAQSFEYAKENVKHNNLEDRITLVQRKPEDALIPLDELNIPSIDFTMTNPPFYKSVDEMIEFASKKSRPPFTACTGAQVEMVTPGGEAAFVNRILQESLVLKERVRWYTSMFGFFMSLFDFVGKLKEMGIDNYAVTEFVQGNKTRRWAVAWSFGDKRPAVDVARGITSSTSTVKSILPPATEAEVIRFPTPEEVARFAEAFVDAVSGLDLTSWTWDQARLEGIGRAPDKVWGRAWRRRKKREIDSDENANMAIDRKSGFGFKLYVRVGTEETIVGCRWLEGHDCKAFESFQGYLRTTAKGILHKNEQ